MFAELIQIFPDALKTQPQIFDIKDLQELDIILADLDHEVDEVVVEKVKNWFKTHTNARDTLIQFASPSRQVNSSPRQRASSEAAMIQNLFELRQTNQEILRQNNQNPPTKSDDKQ
ncbi:MAG: hypothetical protein ACRDEA_19885 [Microcystaceae cyanobacterium]